MLKSKNLKEIIWNGNNVELKGINFIVEGLNNKNIKLKSLCLRNTSLTEEALKILAKGLINNECLKILDIGANNINYLSFKDLCDALTKTKIKIFRCKGNSLGDESAKYFSETILNKETTSLINSFDFSSCKIYDQGLIYLLHALIDNDKISWINLRDNFFSHEIDFVILNFLEKNSYITHIDLTKNRFSFQCLQKVNKIIKRNRNIQNNKEPNKLLVELYSLKYENTKLNELKETLKVIENDYNLPFDRKNPPLEIEGEFALLSWKFKQGYKNIPQNNYKEVLKKNIKLKMQPYGSTYLRMTEMPLIKEEK
jgi:Ran GTPase-activating protein (RanGAP) involved in mRNA processing and transport